MRLTAEQREVIRNAVREVYGEDSRLWLFGSRVDDARRGGDIDLLVRPDTSSGGHTLMDKVRLLGKLERGLGERKIDILIETPDDQRPIVKIAHESGISL